MDNRLVLVFLRQPDFQELKKQDALKFSFFLQKNAFFLASAKI